MTDNNKITKKKSKKQRKESLRRRISHLHKPEGTALKDWQILLRKQAAKDEHFSISCVDDKNFPGEYMVKNPTTDNTYKVVYRGSSSCWNYCSCMDFKTSRLGTCKHIEAVKHWISTRSLLHVHREIPPYTSVFVDYSSERKVRIRIGTDHED